MIAPVLRKLHDSYRNIRFDIITGKRKPSILSGLERVTIHRQLSWPKFKNFMSGNYAHIALAPLQDTPFNRAKTYIKLLDASTLGAVGIYTNSPPYNEVITDGLNGLLVNNSPECWYNAISGLIEQPERMLSLAKAWQALAEQIGDPKRLERFWRERLSL